MPDNVFGSDDDNNVVPPLTWEEQMELEDDPADINKVNKSGKCLKGKKLYLTKVEENTEENLQQAIKSMSNEDQKDLRGKFIVPDMPFTTPPRLDKLMAMECSMSVKSAEQSHSHIQALFLDAAGPLMGQLDNINKNNPIVVEAAVKAALTFMGNSSQCNVERRTL